MGCLPSLGSPKGGNENPSLLSLKSPQGFKELRKPRRTPRLTKVDQEKGVLGSGGGKKSTNEFII